MNTTLTGSGEAAEDAKIRLGEKVNSMRKDIQDMEGSLQRAEEERAAKEQQIKTLNEEMARQEEQIGTESIHSFPYTL